MRAVRIAVIFFVSSLGIGLSERIAAQEESQDAQPKSGASSFCLYELPAENNGKKRWVNLAIVQYIETTRDEFKIVYGGGNLGSGYEARFPITSPDEASVQLQKMMDRAQACY
ncbi:hypothetical protein SKTS_34660 [Sulfurimicrobium lacus]|uniref:Uncharacterized protein n=1 Tax=Sulfurimicrobium lacus TaxID=2715678 RepID=A0A6F8VGV7_9PROT|nr:hypothetical protein [Sulfurimicrobium lacus]BCB28580.1 hypothetical protein SKTS_34660 [Sulfurimicrobium lacus]